MFVDIDRPLYDITHTQMDSRLFILTLSSELRIATQYSTTASPIPSTPGFWSGTPKEDVELFSIFYLTATFTTISFCILSIIIIILWKNHKTLSNKNLISLTISILISHIILASELLDWTLNRVECYVAAATAQWAELSTMVWLNVFAIDIWKATYKLINHDAYRENRQMKLFRYYSLYAWGSSALFVGLSVVIDHVDAIPIQYKPDYVDKVNRKCWMSTWQHVESITIYTRVPFTVCVIASLVFLILAFVNVRKTTLVIETSFSTRIKRRFVLYVQLTAVRDVGYIINYNPFWGSGNTFANNIVFGINKFIGLYLFVLFVLDVKKTKLRIVNFIRSRKSNSNTFELSTVTT